MDGVVRDEKEVIDYIIVQRGLIGSAIVKLLEKGYKPQLIGAGEDRVNDYTKQLEYVKKSEIGDQMQDLKLVQTPRVTSATEVRNAIKDEDYQKFKKLVPVGVERMYTALKSAIEGKMDETLEIDEPSGLILEGEIFESIQQEASVDDIRKESKFLHDSIEEYLGDLNKNDSTLDDKQKKILTDNLVKISDSLNRVKNLIKGFKLEGEDLKKTVADLVFGELGDKKSKGRKVHKVEELLHDLTDSTLLDLTKRYVSMENIGQTSLEDIVDQGGILDINLTKGLNGISGRDIKKIYNFDSLVGSGLQQRGKGETLFSLVFNSIKNDEAGGDVRSRENGKVIEIKSSNNAGITPKSGSPLSPKLEELVTTGGNLFDIEELKKSRMQKTSSGILISKVDDGGEKSEEFLGLLSRLSGIENPTADDILPIMLLLQLDYYSKKSSEFQTFAVFIERDNAPDKIVIIDSDPKEKTFLTPKNVSVLSNSKIAPKITSSDRVEIYMFNKKSKGKE
jgi:hypothetical protein